MDTIHEQFISAIVAGDVVRIGYYRPSDNRLVERICAAVDYGPYPDDSSVCSRYWVLDYAEEENQVLLGLQPKRIVSLQRLELKVFSLGLLVSHRSWNVPRSWGNTIALTEG